MKIKWDKVIFWITFFALLVSCMTNESERIENAGRIRNLERRANILSEQIADFTSMMWILQASKDWLSCCESKLSSDDVDTPSINESEIRQDYLILNHTHYYNGPMKPLK